MFAKTKKELKSKGEAYLKIKARPGSSKNMAKEMMSNGVIRIDVAARAEKGKANRELVKFLAKEFNIHKENIKIISGTGDKVKLIKIFR